MNHHHPQPARTVEAPKEGRGGTLPVLHFSLWRACGCSNPVRSSFHDAGAVFFFVVFITTGKASARLEPGAFARGIHVDQQGHLFQFRALRHNTVLVVGALRHLERHSTQTIEGAEDCLLAFAKSLLDMRGAAGTAQRLALNRRSVLIFSVMLTSPFQPAWCRSLRHLP